MPHPRATNVDAYVGKRVNERRVMLGLTQQDLASAVGPSYQQIHKWCKGTNRIAASRLWDLTIALGVDANYFFEGLNNEGSVKDKDPQQRMLLELARNFKRISTRKHQDAICSLARALADKDAEPVTTS